MRFLRDDSHAKKVGEAERFDQANEIFVAANLKIYWVLECLLGMEDRSYFETNNEKKFYAVDWNTSV